MPGPAQPLRLAVLVSGAGSLMAHLLAATRTGEVPGVEIVAVLADRDCAGIDLAREAGAETGVLRLADFPDRPAWDEGLADALAATRPDVVVSAGFMKLLGPAVLSAFPDRVLNTHPALLPSFPGAHGVHDALAYGVKVTGASVFVVDAGIDTGRILDQVPVLVEDGDTEDSLHARIKLAERAMLVRTVARIASEGVQSLGPVTADASDAPDGPRRVE